MAGKWRGLRRAPRCSGRSTTRGSRADEAREPAGASEARADKDSLRVYDSEARAQALEGRGPRARCARTMTVAESLFCRDGSMWTRSSPSCRRMGGLPAPCCALASGAADTTHDRGGVRYRHGGSEGQRRGPGYLIPEDSRHWTSAEYVRLSRRSGLSPVPLDLYGPEALVWSSRPRRPAAMLPELLDEVVPLAVKAGLKDQRLFGLLGRVISRPQPLGLHSNQVGPVAARTETQRLVAHELTIPRSKRSHHGRGRHQGVGPQGPEADGRQVGTTAGRIITSPRLGLVRRCTPCTSAHRRHCEVRRDVPRPRDGPLTGGQLRPSRGSAGARLPTDGYQLASDVGRRCPATGPGGASPTSSRLARIQSPVAGRCFLRAVGRGAS